MDRNTSIDNLTQGVFESLSARRAWIEIYLRRTPQQAELSLSARRAWIEIINEVYANFDGFCRSPQGERG